MHKLRRRDWWLGRGIRGQWHNACGNVFNLSGREFEWAWAHRRVDADGGLRSACWREGLEWRTAILKL